MAISTIGLQSQQSDCNLRNQTAISAIRMQSSCIAVRLHQLWLQSQNIVYNLHNLTAISTIRVQYLQSELNTLQHAWVHVEGWDMYMQDNDYNDNNKVMNDNDNDDNENDYNDNDNDYNDNDND